jgi:hypothetical protein
VSRTVLFDKEPIQGLSGLAGLTAPGPGEDVAMVVDAIVLGAKGDGKTQLITHAIRTLDARGAPGLSPDEQLQNEKILGLVLNAKRPLPEANPDQKVRHYVFRVKLANLLAGLGAAGRLGLVLRARAARGYLAAVALSLPVVLGALAALRGAVDAATLAGTAVAGVLGALWALHVGRRDLAARGDVEVVLWDVAGEDVYSDRGAGAYHAFLSALVARRRAATHGYALAPILICNPLALGRSPTDSPYARLRMIMPTFAALDQPQPEVLVVVNRSRLAAAVCAPRAAEAGELIAVLPLARDAPAPAGGEAAEDPLPVVRRQVVLAHCYDGEPAAVGATRFRTIRYDAGLDAETSEAEWRGMEGLPADARGRWRAPEGDGAPARAIEYRYAEGPGSLTGDAAAGFYAWLVRVLWPWGRAQARPTPAAPAAEPDAHGTVKMYAPSMAAAAEVERERAREARGGFRSGS